MKFRLPDARCAAVFVRRHGAILALAMLAVMAFVALAGIAAADRRSDRAHTANDALAASAEKARAILDRDQRMLGLLAGVAADASDAVTQQLLDQLSARTPGVNAAAVADAGGTVQLRTAGGPDEAALAALAADAAREAAARPGAAMLVTQTLRDGDNAALVGLARPWQTADGALGGVVVLAIDRTALTGLDLIRLDGTPLFASDAAGDARLAALGDFPLALRYPPPFAGIWTWPGALPFALLAAAGIAAVFGLLALLLSRLRTARHDVARHARENRELRDRLHAASAVVDRTDELSRAKSRFFAQVTHELRTPLNAIIGFSETIRQEMFGPVANPRYREYAGLIHDAGGHLLSLINDLLDEARIEAGKMEIAPIRVAAPALARSALDLVELLAGERDIALATTGLSSCPDLNIDPRAMKQVLVNLLSNAIKYTPAGGHIELRFLGRDDGGTAIEVADTGIGMSAEDLAVAFEPFGRARGSVARRQPGTGLGLSLARALVRLHGGELTLSSRIDVGTTVTVTLPESAVFRAVAAPARAA